MSNFDSNDIATHRMGDVFVASDPISQTNEIEHENYGTASKLATSFNISTILERPILMPTHYTWSATDAAIGRVPTGSDTEALCIVDSVDIPGIMQEKLRNFRYIRYKSVTCTIRLNFQPFNSGLLKLVWSPMSIFPSRHCLCQINCFEGIELDLLHGSSISLTVPWMQPDDWLLGSDFGSKFGVFTLFALAPLGGPTTASDVYFTVMINYNGVEVAGPTAEAMVAIPQSSTEIIADVKASGFATDSTKESAADVERPLSIQDLCAEWTYFDTGTWKNSDSGSFWSTQLDYLQYDYDAQDDLTTYYRGTPTFLLEKFRFIRADMEIRFKFPRTTYHSGSLLAMYEPAPGSVLSAYSVTNYTLLMNMKEEPEDNFVMTIPYNSISAYKDMMSDDKNLGGITLFVFNKLTAPATVLQTINFLVEYRLTNVRVMSPYDELPPLDYVSTSAIPQSNIEFIPIEGGSVMDPCSQNWNSLKQLSDIPTFDKSSTAYITSIKYLLNSNAWAKYPFEISVFSSGSYQVMASDPKPDAPKRIEVKKLRVGAYPVNGYRRMTNTRMNEQMAITIPYISSKRFYNHQDATGGFYQPVSFEVKCLSSVDFFVSTSATKFFGRIAPEPRTVSKPASKASTNPDLY